MNNTTTIGVFNTRERTEAAINEFRSSGIADSQISSIYGDSVDELEDTNDVARVTVGAGAGATAGAVVGAIAGLVVANGILPGIGSFFVAGPLATLMGLSGAVAAGITTGVVAGGLAGAFYELGVVREDAAIYERHIKNGKFVVVTRSPVSIAKNIFKNNKATEIREYAAA